MEKEKQLKHKGHKFLKFLPKSAAIVTFQSPPISPGKVAPGKAASSRAGSIVPKEARRRLKNGSFDAREPASPMVSCVGQVKSKKKNRAKTKQMSRLAKEFREIELTDNPKEVKKNPHPSNIFKFLKGSKLGKRSDYAGAKVPGPPINKVPQLGHMKQFASGRGVLTNFDWGAYGVAVVPECADGYFSDEEKKRKKVVIPHSAPVTVIDEEIEIKPKKEINLWKRRTMSRPPTLRL